jgi:TolB-like protein
MQQLLHLAVLSGLLLALVLRPDRLDARPLGIIASEDEIAINELVDALQAQSLDHVIIPAAATASETALDRAAALGCDMVLVVRGIVTGYRIEAEIIDTVQGRRLAAEMVTGPQEQVFELIDRLGDRLALSLRQLPQGTVAVLGFDNHAGLSNRPFVSGLPQMLLTSLHQHPELTMVEPSQVEQGHTMLTVPGADGGPAADAELGRWLGAAVAVRGVFAENLDVRIDLVTMAKRRSLATFERRGTRQNLARMAEELIEEVTATGARHRNTRHTVAVLPFRNHGDEQYDTFVDGLADMLTTSLGQTAQLTLIERVQIETAMRNFNLEMSGAIDPEKAVVVGAWLGADAVVLGSFLRFGKVYRIDARMIDAETGEVLAADSESGPEDAVMGLVDDLGEQLLDRFEERVPPDAVGTGQLEVLFRMTKAEMGERTSYFHVCKLYVDGKYMDTSPVVDEIGEWVTLFARDLRSGEHRVQVLHGFARRRGWDGRMPLQPDSFDILIEPMATATVRYTFEVGWFKDRYLYDSTWERAPWRQPASDDHAN